MRSTERKNDGSILMIAGLGAFAAMGVNLADVVIGSGTQELVAAGARSAAEWFALAAERPFRLLYELGLFNIFYMIAFLPVFVGLRAAHGGAAKRTAELALYCYLLGAAVYISSNAAVPLSRLAERYAAATPAERAVLEAAGEAVLARGEDFTPGAFAGTALGLVGALTAAAVMLRGGVFGRVNALSGIVGFGLLSAFTVTATFFQAYYDFAFYAFGMVGGLFVLLWFALTGLRFFALAKAAAVR